MSLQRKRVPPASQVPSALLYASEMEAIVHAGNWTMEFGTKACTWSEGLRVLLDVDAGVVPAHDALIERVHPDDRAALATALCASLADRTPFEMIHRVLLASGRAKIVLHRAKTTYDGDGAPLHTVGILVDITNQQLTRKKLDDATAKLMAVWEHVPEGLVLVDAQSGRVVEVNPFAEQILGLGRDDVANVHFTSFFPAERRARAVEIFSRIAGEPARSVESELVNGIPVEISTSGSFRVGDAALTLASFRNITNRKSYERGQTRVTETMAAMVRASAAIVRADSIDDLLRNVCEAIVGGPFVAASVSEPLDDERRTGAVIAQAGGAASYFDGLVLHWGDGGPAGQGPFARAVRTQRPVASRVADATFAPWRERALRYGIQASLALPVANEERRPVFSIYTSDPDGFGEGVFALFASLADDIGLAARALRSRDMHVAAVVREHAHAIEVEAALEGALAAVVATLEKRDPYTSGHEKRVADLSRLIALELALDDEVIRGLYLAASVHDIGKIAIPAEILTKPTRLSAIEYALVKLHPQAGYDIMNNIPFRWSIAEMVRQHHEYLDGSGYPRGLQAPAILLESRILTVADIVESMSATRPYHAPIGLDRVVDEITAMAPSKLDGDVVAACLHVIERGDFAAAGVAAGGLDRLD